MYVRATTVSMTNPNATDEIMKLIDDSFIPLLKQLPGFISYHGGTDWENGKAISITVWDSMAHAAELRDLMGDIIPQMQALGVVLDPPQMYELTRHITV